jgi:uncharacterized tellurite resistance protein B-like protein
MFESIRTLFGLGPSPAPEAPAPQDAASGIQVAACALLLELAYADGEFGDSERRRIEDALGRHFGLDAAAIAELMAIAAEARRKSIDHFQFTRVVNEHYDLGQKTVLAEVMWGVILADGRVEEHEAYLVRKIANLLDLEPAYLSQARRAAGGS